MTDSGWVCFGGGLPRVGWLVGFSCEKINPFLLASLVVPCRPWRMQQAANRRSQEIQTRIEHSRSKKNELPTAQLRVN